MTGLIRFFLCVGTLFVASSIMADPSSPPVMEELQRPTLHEAPPRQMAGGFTEERPGDSHAQAIADSVKSQILQQAGTNSGDTSEFVVEKYMSQVVAGANYKMKIRSGKDNYLHVKIFKPLPHTKQQPEVQDVQTNKRAQDAL